MRIFVQALDYQLQKVIIKCPQAPIIKVNGFAVLNLEDDQDEHDMKMIELNTKIKNVLYCILHPNVFNQIFTCNSAKKILGWT